MRKLISNEPVDFVNFLMSTGRPRKSTESPYQSPCIITVPGNGFKLSSRDFLRKSISVLSGVLYRKS